MRRSLFIAIHCIFLSMGLSYIIMLGCCAEYGLSLFPFFRTRLAYDYWPSYHPRRQGNWFLFVDEHDCGEYPPEDGEIRCYFYNKKDNKLIYELELKNHDVSYYCLVKKNNFTFFEKKNLEEIDFSNTLRVQIAGNYRILLILRSGLRIIGFCFLYFFILEFAVSTGRILSYIEAYRDNIVLY